MQDTALRTVGDESGETPAMKDRNALKAVTENTDPGKRGRETKAEAAAGAQAGERRAEQATAQTREASAAGRTLGETVGRAEAQAEKAIRDNAAKDAQGTSGCGRGAMGAKQDALIVAEDDDEDAGEASSSSYDCHQRAAEAKAESARDAPSAKGDPSQTVRNALAPRKEALRAAKGSECGLMDGSGRAAEATQAADEGLT
eukprot:scaffold136481_cov19-Prasinocladus_malaysianus.AAC.1